MASPLVVALRGFQQRLALVVASLVLLHVVSRRETSHVAFRLDCARAHHRFQRLAGV